MLYLNAAELYGLLLVVSAIAIVEALIIAALWIVVDTDDQAELLIQESIKTGSKE